MSIEQVYIRNIENGIRGIRLGTKTPETANLSNQFEKLKKVNEGMHDELLTKYKNVVADYKKSRD